MPILSKRLLVSEFLKGLALAVIFRTDQSKTTLYVLREAFIKRENIYKVSKTVTPPPLKGFYETYFLLRFSFISTEFCLNTSQELRMQSRSLSNSVTIPQCHDLI